MVTDSVDEQTASPRTMTSTLLSHWVQELVNKVSNLLVCEVDRIGNIYSLYCVHKHRGGSIYQLDTCR